MYTPLCTCRYTWLCAVRSKKFIVHTGRAYQSTVQLAQHTTAYCKMTPRLCKLSSHSTTTKNHYGWHNINSLAAFPSTMGNAKSNGSDEEEAIVQCETSAGPITMHFYRSWSPHGYDRATTLFEKGYFDHSHFFRVVDHFLVQFGIGYTTDKELKAFSLSTIPDDPKRPELLPFKEGMLAFAGSAPNSRSNEMFIAYDRAGSLGQSPWETPFGKVTSGLENVKNFYKGYGDMPPWGKGPKQGPIYKRGADYIKKDFPLLDNFETCSVQRMNQSTGSNNLIILSSIVLSVILGFGYLQRKKRKFNKITY
eukprot:scaffold27801_cov219-Skeletonema_marinoi.AAC.9